MHSPLLQSSRDSGQAQQLSPLYQLGSSLSPASEPFPRRIVDRICSGQFVEMRDLLTDNITDGSQWPASPTIPARDIQATPARCDITIHLAVLLHGVRCHTFNGSIDKGYVSLWPFIDPGITEAWGEWVAGL